MSKNTKEELKQITIYHNGELGRGKTIKMIADFLSKKENIDFIEWFKIYGKLQ